MPTVEERIDRLENLLENFTNMVAVEFNKAFTAITRVSMRLEEMAIRMEEQHQKFRQELKESHEAFKQEIRESHEAFKEEMRETFDKWAEERKERDKRYEEEKKEIQREWNKRWGELSNKLGTIVEDIIFPATEPVLTSYFKCELDTLSMNVKRKKGNLKDEFDVVAVSQEIKTVFLIEVKSTPKVEYINEFKDKKVERFKKLFTEFNDYKLVLIFASLRLEDDIVNYLTKNGIYAMAYREWEYMDILNFDKLNKEVV
ncbi:MAG: hypothetical protein ABWJ98_04110 [Hydrogenothermaceae bacterium]